MPIYICLEDILYQNIFILFHFIILKFNYIYNFELKNLLLKFNFNINHYNWNNYYYYQTFYCDLLK